MAEQPDYIVEIGGRVVAGPGAGPDCAEASISADQAGRRSFIHVFFQCCNVYQRIYRNRSGTAYQGRCPRCLRDATVRIGPGGTSGRFFTAQ
jgi:hypothetical protein